MAKLLRKLFLCPLGLCPHRFASDDTGCWGECIHCGRKSGFVSRADLRALLDREYENTPLEGRRNAE